MVENNRVDILLVEDNPHDAELTLRALQKNNITHRMVVVSDGEEALDFIFARGAFRDRQDAALPRLIILDLKLPKVGGLEVLKAVKCDQKTKTIPVVVLTSSKEETDILESYRLGVNSYLVKPVVFEKFMEAVRSLGFYWLLLNESPVR